MDVRRTSKRLSYVLRHRPDSIGLVVDEHGWAAVEDVLSGLRLTREDLDRVVAGNDKQRFTFDATGTRIRAAQGHSISVDLGYPPSSPPPVLFHGTAARNVASIRARGLHPAGRHAVHLSEDVATAAKVGARRGEHVVLTIRAAAMAAAGHVFTRSSNGVWLVDAVPPDYLSELPGEEPVR